MPPLSIAETTSAFLYRLPGRRFLPGRPQLPLGSQQQRVWTSRARRVDAPGAPTCSPIPPQDAHFGPKPPWIGRTTAPIGGSAKPPPPPAHTGNGWLALHAAAAAPPPRMSGAVAPSPAVEAARTPSHRRTSSAYNVQGGSTAEAASWSAIANVEERGGEGASPRALPEPATILLFSSRRRRRRAHYESSLVKDEQSRTTPFFLALSSFSVACLGVAQPPRPRVPRGRHACSRTVGSRTVGFHSATPSSASAARVAAAVHRRAAVPPTDHQHDASGPAPNLWSRLARGRGRRRPPRIKRAT